MRKEYHSDRRAVIKQELLAQPCCIIIYYLVWLFFEYDFVILMILLTLLIGSVAIAIVSGYNYRLIFDDSRITLFNGHGKVEISWIAIDKIKFYYLSKYLVIYSCNGDKICITKTVRDNKKAMAEIISIARQENPRELISERSMMRLKKYGVL